MPKKAQTSKNEKIKKVGGTPVPIRYGSTVKNFSLTFCAKFFSWLLHMYIDPQKNLGEKPNVKFFTVARYLEVISEVGLFESAKNETFCLF